MPKATSRGKGSGSFVVLLIEDGLPHAVDIFLAGVFALLEGHARGYFLPPCLLVEALNFVPSAGFLLHIFAFALCFLVFLLFQELFQLLASLLLALLFLLILLVLRGPIITDFCLNCYWMRSSSSRIRRMVSSSTSILDCDP